MVDDAAEAAAALAEREPRWQDYASCAGAGKLFFSTRKEDVREAKRICARCPVKTECLDEALQLETSANSVFGVRGGMDDHERKALRRQPRRGGRT
jgi:WhiB family redox-sensing transcriptional regulator